MRYFGGKARVASTITAFLNDIRESGQAYWEPFVGGGWILSRIRGVPNYASDKHTALITMWTALVSGWLPPHIVTADDYESAKDLPDTDPLKAFIGFGCSFGGKWFGGYARSGERNYAANAANSLGKKIASMPDTAFFQGDFLSTEAPAVRMLIYCDPPYRGTTGYATGDFDHALFWERCRSLSREGHTVIISEYSAPPDFTCIAEIKTRTDIRNSDGEREDRVERLFAEVALLPESARLGNYETETRQLELF